METKNEYIFERNQQEHLRLHLVEEALDLATIAHLEGAGVRAGWRCLELGAGAGSVMKWMANVVGDNGSVVGIDKNTAHLGDLPKPCEVVAGDFLEGPVEAGFDLAHCRYVLIHNRNDDEMLTKLASSLKPGGFLVVEEPDFSSAKLLNSEGDASQQRVNNAICRMFEELQLNPAYGLSLPAKIACQGFQLVEVDSRMHLARGGSAMARMMAASTRALAGKYVATGETRDGDIEAYIRNAENPRLWAVYYSTVSVVARKASE
jgi:SAM-dependent methyltransferase